MSEAAGGRRAIAEVRWEDDSGTIVWVGSRTLHHYWTLVSPYFRDVLLPPHRRSDDDSVTWAWNELPASRPPSPSELASVRKRLASDLEAFTDNLARHGAAPVGHAGVEQLGAVMACVVERLIACSDAELAAFVCRTDSGLRLHSWSATRAAAVAYPDEPHDESIGASSTHASGGSGAAAHRRRRRAVVVIILLLGAALAAAWWLRRPRPEQTAPRRIATPARESTDAPANAQPPTSASNRAAAPKQSPGGVPDNSGAPATNAAAKVFSPADTATDAPTTRVELARDIIVRADPAKLGAAGVGAPRVAGVAPTPPPGAHSAAAASGNIASNEPASPEVSTSARVGEPADVSAAGEPGPRTDASVRLTPARPAAAFAPEIVETERTKAPEAPPHPSPPPVAPDRETPRERDEVPARARAFPAPAEPREVRAERRWDRVVEIGISTWEPRLVGDAILPTVPVRAGEKLPLDPLRAAVLGEVRGRMPRTLREPVVFAGLGLRVRVGEGALEWRHTRGFLPSLASASGSRAEIGWTGARPWSPTESVLQSADGSPLAEIIVDARGEATLRLAENVAAEFWAAVEIARVERTSAPAPDATRFTWRIAGEPVSGSPSPMFGESGASHVARCVVPLTRLAGATHLLDVALVDSGSDWALAAELRFTLRADAKTDRGR